MAISEEESREFLAFEDIPIGSIWMAASGASFGYLVVSKKSKENGDIICRGFCSTGWYNEDLWEIDWFKLQYRYYRVV